MNKDISKRVTSLALLLSLLVSGCGKKSNCEIPSRHIHKYTKEISDDITIEKYLDNEHLKVYGYDWNPDYIEITKDDEALYKVLNSKNLFEGVNNWKYLYNVMSNHHDYLMFYYEYDTVETYTTTDDEGNVTVHTRTVHHDGWHSNPYDSDNTGKTRLYHHRYYGYRVLYENGSFKLEKSPDADDIRDIIYDYPYFSEDCVTKVYEQFKFSRFELPNLSPDDFDTFNQPDLRKENLYDSKIKIRL